ITVTGLTNDTAYTFKVIATNAEGESVESSASTAVTPKAPATVPDAPTNVTAVAGDGEATVNFTAPSNDGGSAITGYTVKVYEDGIEKTALQQTGTTSPITVTGLTNDTAYTFKVIATNAEGESVESAASTAVTPKAPATVPNAPTNVTAMAGNGEVTVNFTAPLNDGGSTITGYTVKVYENGVEKTALKQTGTTSPITVTGLTNDTAYTFKVIATNAEGESV
ncbi:MAG: fibronectin type III domain-containing protein, partial [Lysinibacillus sp.]